MTCPRCGYARSDFDTHCLRCRLMDAQGIRPAVNIADQTIVMSDLPDALPSLPVVRHRSRTWVPVLLVLLALLALLTGALWRHQGRVLHSDRTDAALMLDSRMRFSS